MGVQDRDWHKDRHNLERKNPNWQQEYARWYGKPKQRPYQQGVHWTLRLMLCCAIFLAVYVATKHLFFTSNKPAPAVVRQPGKPEPMPTPTYLAPSQVLYKCQNGSGETVYKDTPCPKAATTTVIQRPAQTQPTTIESQADRDIAAAAARKRADEELARQWDQRMAQRDRDLANEQASLSAQANAAGAACAALRQEKEAVLANLRRGGDVQWMNFWNQRFHTVSDALYRNRC